jgi:hypothetical protein
VTGTAATAQTRSGPTILKDRRGDVRGALDIVRVAMARDRTGRIRGELTMAEEWGVPELRGGGPGSSVCLRLHTRRDADAEPPDYLVCLTAPKSGDELVGRVLRDRSNGLPKAVGDARVSRPTGRTAYVRFTRTSVGRPRSIRFAAEAVTYAGRCPAPLGCRDLGPNPPATGLLGLRTSASRG